jgi:hypothetical protein
MILLAHGEQTFIGSKPDRGVECVRAATRSCPLAKRYSTTRQARRRHLSNCETTPEKRFSSIANRSNGSDEPCTQGKRSPGTAARHIYAGHTNDGKLPKRVCLHELYSCLSRSFANSWRNCRPKTGCSNPRVSGVFLGVGRWHLLVGQRLYDSSSTISSVTSG